MTVFSRPLALVLSLLIPAAAVLRRLGIFSRPSIPATLCDWNGVAFKWDDKFFTALSAAKEFCAALGFVCAVISLAGPAVAEREKICTSPGAAIIFALDISPSMAARDIDGMTRMDAARAAIAAMVEDEKGAAAGLVAIGKEAALIVPPTIDRPAFLSSLASLKAGDLGDGTALGDGICAGLFHLVSSDAPKKCVALVTDGENNSGVIHPETAALMAGKNGVAVYALGVGTSGSVSLDYTDPKSGEVRSGRLESNFDPHALRHLASLSGGEYYGVQNSSELKKSLGAMARETSVAQTFMVRTKTRDIGSRFVFLSLVFFALAWILSRLALREAA